MMSCRTSYRGCLSRAGKATPAVEVEFKALEDFHPDALYQRLEVFQALRTIRKRLLNPVTFAQAEAELRRETQAQSSSTEPHAGSIGRQEQVLEETDDAAIERLLGKKSVNLAGARPATQQIAITEFVKRIVTAHFVPEVDVHQKVYVQSIDVATGEFMRAVLHHPVFQGLESV
jgi:hypothetical protein